MTNESVKSTASYEAESYWSRVGQEMRDRQHGQLLAGDNDPYYEYKQEKFHRKFLDNIDFSGKKIMEIGCGGGANLIRIATVHKPEKLIGIDRSAVMIENATQNTSNSGVQADFHKTDGMNLPLPDGSVDIAYSATVLQHVTEGDTLTSLVAEICRVANKVIIMEDIGKGGLNQSNPEFAAIARSTETYSDLFSRNGFSLENIEFLNTKLSRKVHRKIRKKYKLTALSHNEGERISALPYYLMKFSMPITKLLDNIIPEQSNLAKMTFVK